MTLSSWLAAQAGERAAQDLTRRLAPRGPGQPLVDLAGNDYLGLSTDPRVTAAATEAITRWGAGAGASRLVTGSLTLHARLEEALAGFTGSQAALCFSSGYLANLGVVAALTDPETLIVSDAHVHASLVDACRLARPADLVVVPHNAVDAVEAALRQRRQPRALVLVESVYSVVGDAAPLTDLAEVAGEYDAVLVVDEAHALGVAGVAGSGLVHAGTLSERCDVAVTATLSKALGAQGGVVLGGGDLVDHLVNAARSFIYDTGLAPGSAAAALRALEVVREEPERPARALAVAARIADASGLDAPAGCVLSVPMRTPADALVGQQRLADAGFRVGCFRPPSVPDRVSRLRLTAKATLGDDDADRLVRELARLPGVLR